MPFVLVLCLAQGFGELLVTPWNQEAQLVSAGSVLLMLNDLLCEQAVLLQGYRTTASAVAAALASTDASSSQRGGAFPIDVPLPCVPGDESPDQRADAQSRPKFTADARALTVCCARSG